MMVRNIIFVVVIFAGLLLATVFAALNPGLMTLDLAYQEAQVPKSLALAVAFGAGWVFGLLCAGIMVFNLVSERRKLRRALNLADTEVKTLRSMSIQDAD
jgi:uncharacterized membrane protein YciS (DUF1049 family)